MVSVRRGVVVRVRGGLVVRVRGGLVVRERGGQTIIISEWIYSVCIHVCGNSARGDHGEN